MNFGETIGYWYLRLNGFFPLPNFVLHRSGVPNSQNADADILAIRHPFVQENVGGNQEDWDSERLSRWGLNLEAECICLIVEVKTGGFNAGVLETAFSRERLSYALRRFGVLQSNSLPQTLEKLAEASIAKVGTFSFGKLLISNSVPRSTGIAQTQNYLHLHLTEAIAFIRERMRRYHRQKSTARMFFPSDLIQFLAWESGVQPTLEPGCMPESDALIQRLEEGEFE
jgi:hypothetical protein